MNDVDEEAKKKTEDLINDEFLKKFAGLGKGENLKDPKQKKFHLYQIKRKNIIV